MMQGSQRGIETRAWKRGTCSLLVFQLESKYALLVGFRSRLNIKTIDEIFRSPFQTQKLKRPYPLIRLQKYHKDNRIILSCCTIQEISLTQRALPFFLLYYFTISGRERPKYEPALHGGIVRVVLDFRHSQAPYATGKIFR